jgi:multisubunit Na+/H+ antiporter MnhB subunit
VTRLRRHLALAVGLSGVGFSLAAAYELLGVPDVALVALLIETLMMLLFVAVFALLPRRVLQREAAIPVTGSRCIRDPLVGVISGALVLLVVWAGFSRPVRRTRPPASTWSWPPTRTARTWSRSSWPTSAGSTLWSRSPWCWSPARGGGRAAPGQAVVTTVLTRMVARLLLVPVLMVTTAILIKGYVDVGDGFAAGVIAALGVLLQYLAFGRAAVRRPCRCATRPS